MITLHNIKIPLDSDYFVLDLIEHINYDTDLYEKNYWFNNDNIIIDKLYYFHPDSITVNLTKELIKTSTIKFPLLNLEKKFKNVIILVNDKLEKVF